MKKLGILGVVLGFCLSAMQASALPYIKGQLEFDNTDGDLWSAPGPGNEVVDVFDSYIFRFIQADVHANSTGDFLGSHGEAVTWSPAGMAYRDDSSESTLGITTSGSNSLDPMAWTFDGFTFSLNSAIEYHMIELGTLDSLIIKGTGWMSKTGFNDTKYMWTISTESGPGVTDLSFSATSIPVPEPSSIALFGLGLLGLGIARRKAA